uniref:Uncharacterized protein n=1 Tax=Pyrococcus abyssi (strain GE5 / Orsay) TaxID=272844 RepID=G8ZJK5_PYRAB|nr:TPA: hypothetical protein PAB1670 [Pyrococcus abyssi GE5]
MGVSVLVLASLGALSMLISVIITRPLYASLVTFGIIFILQFLLPQIPYIKESSKYSLSYQTMVLLKSGFEKVNLLKFTGIPEHSEIAFIVLALLMLLLAWSVLSRREFPD